MANILKTIIENDKGELRRLEKMADKVLKYEDQMAALTDDQLKAKTDEFKERYNKGESLDSLLYEAFAVVREAAKRVLGLFPYKVQVMGGIVLHHGDVPEMRTGEGKTLTATMPVYLNALAGEGVHVVTVNEYLTERDATEMGELYSWLGLSVGINLAAKSPMEKKEAYLCDITYSTNSEIGFDYLRDNMVVRAENMVQRPLNYALVDEVDSILIDEARTPLIVSGANAVETSQLIIWRITLSNLWTKMTISLISSLRLLVCLIQGLTRLKTTSNWKISTILKMWLLLTLSIMPFVPTISCFLILTMWSAKSKKS